MAHQPVPTWPGWDSRAAKDRPNSGYSSVSCWYITIYIDRTPLQIVDLKLQNADSTLQIVDSELRNSDSKLQDLDSELHDVDSELQTLDSELQNWDLKLQNVDSKLQDIDSKLQTLDSTLQNRAKMAENSRHQGCDGRGRCEAVLEDPASHVLLHHPGHNGAPVPPLPREPLVVDRIELLEVILDHAIQL